MDHDALLEDARTGDPTAWRHVHDELAPAVAGYLRLQGARDVDDLVSEVFLGVFRGLPSFDGTWERFRSWVFVIAHHRLVDERRRSARRVEATLPEGADVAAAGPEDEALDQVATAGVVARCAALPPDQRDVLLLRIIGDMTVEQVADALGKTPGAVKALQRRGLARLHQILTSEGVPL